MNCWPRWLARLYRLYFSTWRTWGLLPDGKFVSLAKYSYGPVIFAHSEREALAIACVTDYSHFAVLVAPGRDGDRATTALESIGCQVIRGSSLRDGLAAMVGLTRLLSSTRKPVAICVDGPLGPKGRAKQGVLLCAQVSGRPIIPIATAARWRIVIPGTWSRIFLPLPFSKVVISAGDALLVNPNTNRTGLKECACQLEHRLLAEQARAEAAVAGGDKTAVS
ncbi:MAG TPA: DUF374 domain-containing protein [Acidobacteriota bacterium]|jgi:hypothetical protein